MGPTSLSNLLREATTTEADIAVGIVLVVILWTGSHRSHAIALSALLIVSPIAQHELKDALDRDRPPYDLDAVWSDPQSRSFPSGHTMSATVIYGWLLYCALALAWPTVARRFAVALSIAILTLVPFASVYLAVHWPSDVIGGYLWGLCLVLPAVWFARAWSMESGRAP